MHFWFWEAELMSLLCRIELMNSLEFAIQLFPHCSYYIFEWNVLPLSKYFRVYFSLSTLSEVFFLPSHPPYQRIVFTCIYNGSRSVANNKYTTSNAHPKREMNDFRFFLVRSLSTSSPRARVSSSLLSCTRFSNRWSSIHSLHVILVYMLRNTATDAKNHSTFSRRCCRTNPNTRCILVYVTIVFPMYVVLESFAIGLFVECCDCIFNSTQSLYRCARVCICSLNMAGCFPNYICERGVMCWPWWCFRIIGQTLCPSLTHTPHTHRERFDKVRVISDGGGWMGRTVANGWVVLIGREHRVLFGA